MLWPTRLKFQGVMGDIVGWFTAGLVEDWIKTQPTWLFLCSKIAKNGILVGKTQRTTGLKLSMHTQHDSGSNMGWVPPGHTPSSGMSG